MATKIECLGLYELIGGASNGELNSKNLALLIQPDVAPTIKKRLLAWKEELRFWEEYGEIYVNLEKAQPYYRLTKAVKSLLDPKPGDNWLDVGCGPLGMSELICQKCNGKVANIEAIDVVLKPAKEKLEKLAKQSIDLPVSLKHQSITDLLPYPDNYFDGIAANLVLPYVTDFMGQKGKEALEGVLREMFRILKPGGHMVWTTPKDNVNFIWVFIASVPDMLNVYEYIAHKDFTRILQGTRILKHALTIQKKGREGIYTFLPREELEDLLVRKIGFANPVWIKTFTQQVWGNRVYKP